jgi:hypothetical protein
MSWRSNAWVLSMRCDTSVCTTRGIPLQYSRGRAKQLVASWHAAAHELLEEVITAPHASGMHTLLLSACVSSARSAAVPTAFLRSFPIRVHELCHVVSVAQSEENKPSLDDAVRALQKYMHEFHGDRDHAMCNTQNRSIPASPLDAGDSAETSN